MGKAFSVLIGTTIVAVICMLSMSFYHVAQVAAMANAQFAKLEAKQNAIQQVKKQVLANAVQQALLFAPLNQTKYQLRGDAQRRAQQLLEKLETKNNMPHYQLPALGFTEFKNGLAGETFCPTDGIHGPSIVLDQILYYRNYLAYMYEIIPHEVAHAASCLKWHKFQKESHGSHWRAMMRQLGFRFPSEYEYHNLDMRPIRQYFSALSAGLKHVDHMTQKQYSGRTK